MAKISKDLVFDELLCFLSEPVFQIPVRSFLDENCIIFDVDTPPLKEHQEIFNTYKRTIDMLLDAFCADADLTFDEVIKGIAQMNKVQDLRDMFYELFEQVLAAVDFKLFFALMATRNILIQEQVLKMILAASGCLPSSLSHTVIISHVPNQPTTIDKSEDVLLNEVIKNTKSETTKNKSAEYKNIDKNDIKISQNEAKCLEENRLCIETQMKNIALNVDQNATMEKDKSDISHSEAASNWLKVAQSESIESKSQSSFAASMSQMSPEEIKKRQDFLRQQRDKLLLMKKEARERQLNEAEPPQTSSRPVSARTARSAMKNQVANGDTEDAKRMAMRRAIADKLRQEVIGKPM